MKKTIICETNGKTMSFFCQIGNVKTYLFNNRRIKIVNEIYKSGVEVHRLFALSHHTSYMVQHISAHILDALRKYQKETGVEIFSQKSVRYEKSARPCYALLDEVA